MPGQASAPGAVTVVNAISSGRGAALAIDRRVEATVSLDATADGVTGDVCDQPVDSTLVERCVERTIERCGRDVGATIETRSNLPAAVGLSSSSAAANAAVAATMDALGEREGVDPLTIARIGVAAAREVGVTATGAFDDAAASALGGLAVTDNRRDAVLEHRPVDVAVAVVVPTDRTPTATVDRAALERFRDAGDLAVERVRAGDLARAMAINAVIVCAALDVALDPVLTGLAGTGAASPSGTGPAVAALGDEAACARVATQWRSHGRILACHSDDRGLITPA